MHHACLKILQTDRAVVTKVTLVTGVLSRACHVVKTESCISLMGLVSLSLSLGMERTGRMTNDQLIFWPDTQLPLPTLPILLSFRQKTIDQSCSNTNYVQQATLTYKR